MNRTSHARHAAARSTSRFRTFTSLFTSLTVTLFVAAFLTSVLLDSSFLDRVSYAAATSPATVLNDSESESRVIGSPGTLGNFATFGLSGATVFVTPSNITTNATFSNLTRGSGLTAASVTNAYNSSGWPITAAPDANDYYEFTISPGAGFQFSATELRVGMQRSSTGPSNIVLRSSLDGFTSNIGPVIAPPVAPAAVATSAVDLSTVGGLQNSASPVTLRLYGYGASSGAGTLRIERVTSVPMVGLEVDGTAGGPCVAPVITTHPVDITVRYAGKAVFTAAADGTPPPTVVWEVSGDDGETWWDTGVTSATLSFRAIGVAMDGNLYRAIFSNGCGGATTEPARLSINRKPITPSATGSS